MTAVEDLAEAKARLELELIEAETESVRLSRERMEENAALLESTYQFADPREQFYDDPQFHPIATTTGYNFYRSQPDDRTGGQFRPIFENEIDLHVIRAQAGRVIWFDEIGIGALESLKNYTFQDGLEYTVSSVNEQFVPDAMVDEVRELIEHILFINGYYHGLEREYHDRARVEGEYQFEHKWRNNDVHWHEHEPEHLCEPDEVAKRELEDWLKIGVPQCWRFGVHTAESETEHPLGYHFVFNNTGTDWDYVPAERMTHYKRNVYRKTKRGVSDFMPIIKDLERDSKLVESLALGAALQASIAWITQYPASTRNSTISSAIVGGATYKSQVQKESGTANNYHHKYRPGSILNVKEGKEYLPGPMGSDRNPNFILVSQHLRRTVGVRFSLPEFMVSNDASNGNYSSTSQAADWFVKARENNQREFGWPIVSAIYKSLRMYSNRGMLNMRGLSWDEFSKYIRIKPKGKDPSTKSPLEKRQALALEMDYGLTAPETAATECGRQYTEEIAKGAERQANPNMQAEQEMSESVMEGRRQWEF